MQKSIGVTLLDQLQKRGVNHIFGVPGDYVLRFDKLIEEHTIKFVNATRESSAGTMADAYARCHGLGAVCITYGVGLNIVNAISQAYTESSPVILISGAPGRKELERSRFLHHLVHKPDLDLFENTQREILNHITAAQTILDDPLTAEEEINRTIDIAVRYKKPVYIELPRDSVLKKVASHSSLQQAHPEPVAALLKQAKAVLEKSKHPILWVGHEAQRYQLAKDILHFAEQHRIPIVTTLLGKATFDENHPLVYGVYQGALSRPEIQACVDACDASLLIGVIQTDLDTGIFTAKLDHKPHLAINGILLPDFVQGLTDLEVAAKNPPAAKKAPAVKPDDPHSKICIQRVFDLLQTRIPKNALLIADIGDCLFGASDLVLPQDSFLCNSYYASMGFAVPAALGACLAAPDKRVIALVGDGAFQMTGSELSTAVRYQLDPIIILFNNKGYGTERPLLEGKYNDIVNWNYAEIPQLLSSGTGFKIKTEEQFIHAFETALKRRGTFTVIEIEMDKLDFTTAAKRFGALVEKTVKSP